MDFFANWIGDHLQTISAIFGILGFLFGVFRWWHGRYVAKKRPEDEPLVEVWPSKLVARSVSMALLKARSGVIVAPQTEIAVLDGGLVQFRLTPAEYGGKTIAELLAKYNIGRSAKALQFRTTPVDAILTVRDCETVDGLADVLAEIDVSFAVIADRLELLPKWHLSQDGKLEAAEIEKTALLAVQHPVRDQLAASAWADVGIRLRSWMNDKGVKLVEDELLSHGVEVKVRDVRLSSVAAAKREDQLQARLGDWVKQQRADVAGRGN